MWASSTPVRQTIFLRRYLHETDESLNDIWAASANLSSSEQKAGKKVPKRNAIAFLLVEGYRKLKNRLFNG